MSVPKYLKTVAPSASSFHLVTQKRLPADWYARQQVASDNESGINKPTVYRDSTLEMHGKIFDVKCTKGEYCREDRIDPLSPALEATVALFNDHNDAPGSKEINILVEELPHCPECGEPARPGVVRSHTISMR